MWTSGCFPSAFGSVDVRGELDPVAHRHADAALFHDLLVGRREKRIRDRLLQQRFVAVAHVGHALRGHLREDDATVLPAQGRISTPPNS